MSTAALHRTGDRDLYHPGMAKRVLVGIQQLRLRVKERVDAVVEQGEHTVFTRHGRPVAVLVPMSWYREAAEKVGDPTDL